MSRANEINLIYRDEIVRSLNEPDWIKPVWTSCFFINTLKKQPVWIWVKSNTSIYNGIYIIYLQHAPSKTKRPLKERFILRDEPVNIYK